MNKILVEVSVGELLDKVSILEIKKEKIKDPELVVVAESNRIAENNTENILFILFIISLSCLKI